MINNNPGVGECTARFNPVHHGIIRQGNGRRTCFAGVDVIATQICAIDEKLLNIIGLTR
ncbi:hypothetical protein D3C78_488840 [compost metagenome]